jgi:hypothetical protein
MSPIESPMGAAYGGIQQGEVENCIGRTLEAISKIGFWFQIAAGPSLKPQATRGLSRI